MPPVRIGAREDPIADDEPVRVAGVCVGVVGVEGRMVAGWGADERLTT